MGWLIVEDLVTVLILVMLPALATSLGGDTGGADHPVPENDATADLCGAWHRSRQIHWVCSADAGRRFPIAAMVPRNRWSATGSRELFTLAVIAVAIGIGFEAAELFGLSFALGAFFAGVVVGESDHSHRAAEEMRPLQDAFTALFFVAMGMLFDPQILVKQPFQVLAVLAIIVLGKSAVAFLVVVLLGRPIGSALVVAASLAQIGEFSFILAELGIGLHLLPAEGQSLIVAGALLSIALNSFLMSAVGAICKRMESPAKA